jgi:hypothetical protein
LNIPAIRMLRHCRRAKSGNCNKLECRLRVNSRAHYKVWHAGLYRGTSFEQQRSKLSVAMILRVDVEYVGHWMYATHVKHDGCASIEYSRADIAKQLRLHVLGRDFLFLLLADSARLVHRDSHRTTPLPKSHYPNQSLNRT